MKKSLPIALLFQSSINCEKLNDLQLVSDAAPFGLLGEGDGVKPISLYNYKNNNQGYNLANDIYGQNYDTYNDDIYGIGNGGISYGDYDQGSAYGNNQADQDLGYGGYDPYKP